jgi:hypothetical protein
MIPLLLDLVRSLAELGLFRWLGSRDRLTVITWWTHQPNTDGVGTYLAFFVKIINRGDVPLYVERVECDDAKGDVYFPTVIGMAGAVEVPPRRNVVVFIPCGHITKPLATALRVVDSTERVHRPKLAAFLDAVRSLSDEQLRLQSLGFSVHPNSTTMMERS